MIGCSKSGGVNSVWVGRAHHYITANAVTSRFIDHFWRSSAASCWSMGCSCHSLRRSWGLTRLPGMNVPFRQESVVPWAGRSCGPAPGLTTPPSVPLKPKCPCCCCCCCGGTTVQRCMEPKRFTAASRWTVTAASKPETICCRLKIKSS